MNRETFNGQLTSKVVTFQVENYYKLKRYKERKMSFSNMSNNDYCLHRPGFNPSCRATYTIFHPSTNNFYTTMSVGRALHDTQDFFPQLYLPPLHPLPKVFFQTTVSPPTLASSPSSIFLCKYTTFETVHTCTAMNTIHVASVAALKHLFFY